MSDRASRSTLSEVRLKPAYNCVFCGKPMYHRGGFQPSMSYAECWECWAKHAIAGRDKWRTAANRWALCVPVAFLAGLGIGLVVQL